MRVNSKDVGDNSWVHLEPIDNGYNKRLLDHVHNEFVAIEQERFLRMPQKP